MKVIVTGAAGHFGSQLVGQLLHQGIEVIGIDNLLYGGEGLLAHYSHPRFQFHKIDIRQEFLAGFEDADTIVHLAAMVGSVCEQDTEMAWDTNLGATAMICDKIKATEVKLIFASTCSNYGVLEGTATEESALEPLGTYAKTKVAAEKLIYELEDRGVILRFATLAGISPRPRFDLLLNQWSLDAISKGEIDCYQPDAWRPFVHVSDAANALTMVLTRWPNIQHHCYNVVGFNTTKGDLAKAIKNHTDCRVTDSSGTADPRSYSVSGDLIRKDLGFFPHFSMTDCINEVCSALSLDVLSPRESHYNHI